MSTRLIATVIILVISLGVGFFVVWPKYQNFRQLQTALESKRAELDSKTDYYSKAAEIWSKLEEYEDSLSQIESSVSKDYSLPAIFNHLQRSAGQTGLVLEDLTFEGVSGDDLKEINFSLYVSGTYASFKNFLKALESSARLFSIKNIKFSSPQKGEVFSFELALATYSY